MYLGPNICTFSCHGPTRLTLISHRFVKGHQGELFVITRATISILLEE